ncbi:MAG TPA: F0F1 ATP synthase subunit A [Epulopiscium sp.]|nr:F0F1 ATP synthase subunit A [Candidatus Epulonipiscium sp.]
MLQYVKKGCESVDDLDFGFRTIVKLFEIDGQPVGFTTTIINTWIVMAALTVIALVVKHKLSTFTDIPTGKFQNIVEAIVEALEGMVTGAMGKEHKGFAPFYGSMLIFILFCNLLGLIGLRPPTADIATTFALSITTFVMIQGYAIRTKKLSGYLKGFFEPIPLLFPINLFGELANPISLSFRLFGNLIGGTVIMALVYAALPPLLRFGVPVVLHLYFDVFAGALQSFIFVMLSMTFVSASLEG